MYESFYGLVEKPFTLLPDPDYLYLSPKHQRALTLLEYGMMNHAGFSVICGATGAGKTTLIRRLLAGLGDDTTVGLITNTHKSFGDLLSWVLMAFGLDGEDKTKAQMHQMFVSYLIEQYAKKQSTVLIVDEAQNLSAETLEELRMLSNINADKDQVLQIILAGQPALRDTLRKPELLQFAQRISVDYYLEALDQDETAVYINYRLKIAGSEKQIFSDEACDAIYRYSGGTPRLINLLCDTALVFGYAEQTETISVDLVNDVVKEQHADSLVPTFNKPLSEEEISKIEKKVKSDQGIALTSEELPLMSAEKTENKKNKVQETTVSVQQADASIEKIEIEDGIEKDSEDSEVDITKTDETDQQLKNKEESPHGDSNEIPDELIEQQTEENLLLNEPPLLDDDLERQQKSPEFMSDDQIKENSIDTELSQAQVAEHVSYIDRRGKKEKVESNKTDTDETYPIVHVAEASRRNTKVLIFGFVGGIVLASVLILAAVYILFGDKINKEAVYEKSLIDRGIEASNIKKQKDLERSELDAANKERDAALAAKKILEFERDTARAEAKSQEDMRKVEKRAAEILAEQERIAAAKLKRATERARLAELETIKAREREYKMRIESLAEKTKVAKIKQQEIEKAKQMELLSNQTPVNGSAEKIEIERAVVPELAVEPVKFEKKSVKKEVKKEVVIEVKKETKFKSNPCSSPSAKFLSTCKK